MREAKHDDMVMVPLDLRDAVRSGVIDRIDVDDYYVDAGLEAFLEQKYNSDDEHSGQAMASRLRAKCMVNKLDW